MDDIIKVQDQYYILADSSSYADRRTHVLKHGDTFAVFDHRGDIQFVGKKEQGIYHEGTRHLSYFELLINQQRPLLLSSNDLADKSAFVADLTNSDFSIGNEVLLPRDRIHIHRSIFLWKGACYQRFKIKNYALHQVNATFQFRYKADFADIFEVRGLKRKERGAELAPVTEEERIYFLYQGLDGVLRRTCLDFQPAPKILSTTQAMFEMAFGAHEEKTVDVAIACLTGKNHFQPRQATYEESLAKLGAAVRGSRLRFSECAASNETFNRCFHRAISDLDLMTTETRWGLYPYAGIPWFNTVFGRDGIIAGLQSLWVNPDIARGVLNYLSHTQAKEVNPKQDAEPGKIVHEMRKGEMAALREIPFGRYYGSVDSTPLFLILAAAYFKVTADADFIRSIWPSIEAALAWIDIYGDRDGDGFVEYFKQSKKGLVHQGWKDSNDSVFHADGKLAEGPIALCEVQGYVYAAKLAVGQMARYFSKQELSAKLFAEAEELKKKFEENFWCEEIGTYALALDGEKNPCRVRTSNAGHCLATGIASEKRARRVAEQLLSDVFFTGWGIRTVASSESRYNPMSYHDGSVWPHDNGIIAHGLRHYGFTDLLMKLVGALFEASVLFDLEHFPELFCGFRRRANERPTLYPVACLPQAWSAGVWCFLLQTCLGLYIDAPEKRIFLSPVLPPFLDEVEIKKIHVGDCQADLSFRREGSAVAVEVLSLDDSYEIVQKSPARRPCVVGIDSRSLES